MIPLAIEYKKNGYLFRLVQRSAEVAIYKQIDTEDIEFQAYEVFEVIKYKDDERFGRLIPAHEAVPGSELWGIKGYTLRSLLAAEQKAVILQKRVDDRKKALASMPTIENSGN